ncbi:unnamed protein product [Microthlaspi erraticum]|uniref:Uncharacterized protein n=1 Tax=Microthlaspi erraticum TaxID=1685480 RepID=A0A6D2IWX0_9BRAS|nr:unnamed protein product [Microthlaspi erraticum]
MQVLKGGAILIVTVSFFLITSSMAVIREDQFSIGVKRRVPRGSDPIHNSHHHLVGVERKDQFSIGVKRKVPTGPDPLHNAPEPSPSVTITSSFDWSREKILERSGSQT